MAQDHAGFDRSAAVTRSLLGWGVVAGVFYLGVGITQGMVREGFSFTRHPLSLLMLGEGGWVQSANLIVAGLMVIAAAVGFHRALSLQGGTRATGILVGVYGASLIGSGIFPPDPVDGFPHPGSTAEATVGGVAHLAMGGVGFLALSAAALVMAAWFSRRGDASAALSRAAGGVVLFGFLAGAALSAGAVGILLLWVAVVTGWVWLAATSVGLYRTVPHPDTARR
ncbi:MAG: DUF998 domain-containing protein [Actinomycetota bacterium]